MASKNVALRMDVVKRLDRAKRPGESYSDVIARFLEDRPSISDALRVAREHADRGPDTLTPRLRAIRQDIDRSFDRRRKRLEKVS